MFWIGDYLNKAGRCRHSATIRNLHALWKKAHEDTEKSIKLCYVKLREAKTRLEIWKFYSDVAQK